MKYKSIILFTEDNNFPTDEINSILTTFDYVDNSLGDVSINYEVTNVLTKPSQLVTHSQDN